MTSDYDNVPVEMRDLNAWLVWRYEQEPGEKKPRKIPYYAAGGRRGGAQGSEKDLARLVTFVEAARAATSLGMAGVGFAVLPQWGYTILDFDKCVNGRGDVTPEVLKYVQGTWCELSPGKGGLHCIWKGTLPGGEINLKSRSDEWGWGFEIFHTSGFVTITGKLPRFLELWGPLDVRDARQGGEHVTRVAALIATRWPTARAGGGLNDGMSGGVGGVGGVGGLDGGAASMGAGGNGTEANGDGFVDGLRELMMDAEPLGLSSRALEEMLGQLDPSMGQEEGWLNVLAAVHHETGGSQDGADMCADWSEGKFTADGKVPANFLSRKDVLNRYRSFGRRDFRASGRRPVTARWLVWKINKKKIKERLCLNPKDHSAIARALIEREFMTETGVGLVRSDGLWHIYNDGVYESLGPKTGEEIIAARFHRMLDQAAKRDKEGALVPFHPGRSAILEATSALKAAVMANAGGRGDGWTAGVGGNEEVKAPAWLEGFDGPPTDEIINMSNGLLHVPSRACYDHTTGFFTFNQVPFAWEPDARAPRWEAFLRDVWPEENERDSIETLQEMMGYFLTQDTSFQKMFIIQGVKRTGKGTIGRVINALVGQRNTTASSFAQISGQFGLSSFIGKQLAVFPDERNSSTGRGGGFQDLQMAVSRLLSISGEDSLSIDRKHMSEWHGKLNTRILILSNEIPAVGDSSEVLASRFVFLKTKHSFFGKEDPDLTGKLLQELPGIFVWALKGMERLKARGHFLQPASGLEVMNEMISANNPIRKFVEECCVLGEGQEVLKDDLYARYREWAFAERVNPWGRYIFYRVLKSTLSEIIVEGRVYSGTGYRMWTFEGIGIANNVPENQIPLV